MSCGYLMTMLVVCGHFIAYTYLTPYLRDIGGFSPSLVVAILLVMGGAGVIGSIVLSNTIGRHPVIMFYLPMALVALSLLALKFAVNDLLFVYAICFAWGAAMTGVGLVLQSKVLKLAHDATDVGSSIYSAIYNVGIGAGALIGGQVYNKYGLDNVGYAGFLFVLIALALMIVLKLSFKKAVRALEAR